MHLMTGHMFDIRSDERSFEAVGKPTSITNRLLGAVFGMVFIGVATFLAIMLHDQGPIWITIILWLGLSLIGIALIVSNLRGSDKVEFVTASVSSGTLVWGTRTADTEQIEGQMQLSDILKITVGSDTTVHQTGLTTLYVKGVGAPANGFITTGTTFEMDQMRNHLIKFSGQPQHTQPNTVRRQLTKQG